ncbi:MAG: hypothetical protein JO168_09415 [Solirubrobacterales bacterium]|nr:hypothetical protein [Solirubrobacterales bacterium]MBV9714195.1 hypothetical protein [Solirubrobacterales bacterium]
MPEPALAAELDEVEPELAAVELEPAAVELEPPPPALELLLLPHAARANARPTITTAAPIRRLHTSSDMSLLSGSAPAAAEKPMRCPESEASGCRVQ